MTEQQFVIEETLKAIIAFAVIFGGITFFFYAIKSTYRSTKK